MVSKDKLTTEVLALTGAQLGIGAVKGEESNALNQMFYGHD